MNYSKQRQALDSANLAAGFLSGRNRTGNDQSGTLTHAVNKSEKEIHPFGTAICGRKPGKRSNGWYEPRDVYGAGEYLVDCENCLKKLAQYSVELLSAIDQPTEAPSCDCDAHHCCDLCVPF